MLPNLRKRRVCAKREREKRNKEYNWRKPSGLSNERERESDSGAWKCVWLGMMHLSFVHCLVILINALQSWRWRHNDYKIAFSIMLIYNCTLVNILSVLPTIGNNKLRRWHHIDCNIAYIIMLNYNHIAFTRFATQLCSPSVMCVYLF